MSAAARAGLGLLPVVLLLAAAPAAPLFTAGAVLVGLAVLMDLAGLLSAAAARPVLLAAAVPVVAVPLLAARGDGWAAVPAAFVLTFVLSMVLVLAGRRRRRVTELLGGTLLSALLAGLGAGGLVQLRHLPEGGIAWLVLLLALSAAADLGAPLARAVAGAATAKRSSPAASRRPPEALLAFGGPALAVVVVALVALLAAIEPLTAAPVAAVAAAALSASLIGSAATRLLSTEAGVEPATLRPGGGLLLQAGVTVLLAAPAAAVLLRWL